MKLSRRDSALLIGFAGVLFLVISWFYIATPLQEKTTTLETENIALKGKADLYISISANQEEYEKGIGEMEADIEKTLSHYPAAILRTDEIMFLANMENAHGDDLIVENITMGTPEEVVPVVEADATPSATEAATAQAPADEAAAEAVAQLDGETVEDTYQGELNVAVASPYAALDLHLYKQPVNFTFRCTYTGAKDMITYLFSQTDKKGIDTFNLAYDSETGNLMGSMGMNQFYMVGTNKEYVPLTIPAMNRGVNDLFHTISGSLNTAVDAEAEADENLAAIEENENSENEE